MKINYYVNKGPHKSGDSHLLTQSLVRPALGPSFELFSDMPGFEAPHGGTIPPHILVTNLKPDLFIVSESLKRAVIFELTCPWDLNVSRSHTFKQEKYAPLVADLSRRFTVFHFSVEVTARGQISKDNQGRIRALVFRCCDNPGKLAGRIVKCSSKASLLAMTIKFAAERFRPEH